MAPGPSCSRDAEDTAVRREVAGRELSKRREGGSPREPDPERVQEGAHGSRVWTGRSKPCDGVDNVQASGRREALRYAGCGGDEACQVRVKQVTVLGTPTPVRRQDECAMCQEGSYPRMQVSPWPSDGVEGQRLCLPGFKKTGAEDQAGLGDEGAEGQAEPGFLSGAGRGQEGGEGRPSQGDTVGVMKQVSHGR